MGHVTRWIFGVIPIIPFASFSWAVHAHFNRPGVVHYAMQLLAACSLLSLASYFLKLATKSAEPGLASYTSGAILFTVATGLFWWAIAATSRVHLSLAYSPSAKAMVVSSGPFRLVRHPFYLSYMLFWIGTAVIAGGWQWIPTIALIVWYASIARLEERQFSSSIEAAHYSAYRGRTGMFVPAVWKRSR